MAAILLQLLTVLSLYIWFMRKYCLSLETKLASITRKRTAAACFSSGIYFLFRQKASSETSSAPTAEEWKQLEASVRQSYPAFVNGLASLNYPFSSIEYRVTLLLKLNFPLKEIAVLTCHSKEGISSIRRRLCQKLLPVDRPSPKEWDRFVQSL